MNAKYAQIAMIVATIFAGSTAVYAQAPAAGAANQLLLTQLSQTIAISVMKVKWLR